jgi:hypothetical protein
LLFVVGFVGVFSNEGEKSKRGNGITIMHLFLYYVFYVCFKVNCDNRRKCPFVMFKKLKGINPVFFGKNELHVREAIIHIGV